MEPLGSARTNREATPTSSEIHSGSRRHRPFSSPTQASSEIPPSPGSCAEEETLDLQYSPSPDPPSAEGKDRPTGEEAISSEEEERKKPKTRLQSVLVKPPCPTSYRDAVVGKRTEDGKENAENGVRRNRREPESSRREEEWEEVKARYWWRKNRSTIRVPSTRSIQSEQENPRREDAFRDWFRRQTWGRCCKCLATDHRVVACRDPPKCLGCFKFGHKVKHCRSREEEFPTKRFQQKRKQVPSQTTSSTHQKLEPRHKEQPYSEKRKKREERKMGAPHLRPERVVAVAKRTATMEAEERSMAARAVLAVAVDATVVIPCEAVEEAARRQKKGVWLIHLDEVIDYSPLPESPACQSQESDNSGLPSQGGGAEWPAKHPHTWFLGVIDGRSPQPPPRVPVQERLQRQGCGEGGQILGNQRPWATGESSSQWHLRDGRGSGSSAGRRRSSSCPPAVAALNVRAKKGQAGPTVSVQPRQRSRWTVPDAAFMEAEALMIAHLPSQPLEEIDAGGWDPMRQECALLEDAYSQVALGCGGEQHAREGREKERETGDGPNNKLGRQHQPQAEQQVQPLQAGPDVPLQETSMQTGQGEPDIQAGRMTATRPRISKGQAAKMQRNQNKRGFANSITRKVPRPVLSKAAAQTKQQDQKGKRATQANTDTPRRSGRLAKKPGKNKPMEQQAVELLMKKSGALQPGASYNEEAQEKFADQFSVPLPSEVIKDLKETFGINDEQNGEMIKVGHALAAEAGDEIEAN